MINQTKKNIETICNYNSVQGKSKNENIHDYTGQTVFLYPSRKSSCQKKHKNNVNIVRFMVNDLICNRKYKVCLYYCDICNQYFTNINSITDYIKYGQRLELKFCVISSPKIRKHSLLNLYGYSVRKDNLNDNGRRNLLTRILDKNLVDYDNVINLLTYLIRINDRKECCINAVKLWKDDLDFVIKYKELHNKKEDDNKKYRIRIVDIDSGVCWVHAYGYNNRIMFRLSCSAYASYFPKSFLNNIDLIRFIGDRKYEIL